MHDAVESGRTLDLAMRNIVETILKEKDTATLLEDPVRRRWWFLTGALKYAPLGKAVEIARIAESFVIMSSPGDRSSEIAIPTLTTAQH
jgi:hypothetical protein